MKNLYVILLILTAAISKAQEATIITLESCQEKAVGRYPLTKKRELIAQSLDFSLSNISKAFLPQFSGANQLSWQSDVTEIPISIPGVSVPTINQTQYKAYTDINQLVFDAGTNKQKKAAEKAKANIETQSVEVELYSLRERVNNLYFGILLLDQHLKQNDLYKNDLRIGLKTVTAQIQNGTALRSNADILRAELLKAEQQTITLQSSKNAYLNMLSLFIGETVTNQTKLEIPVTPTATTVINRPELKLFDCKSYKIDTEKKLISKRDIPKLSLFAQSGMSNPGLNMFEDGMQNYFIGGARLTWSVSHTKKKEKAILNLSKEQIEADRETFLFNTNLQLTQQNEEINRLSQNLNSDTEIVALRNSIKKASLSQLENGVINSNDYLREVNEENKAIQNKSTHETELLMAQYKTKTITGN